MTWVPGIRKTWTKRFVDYRNQIVYLLSQESSLMEIVKLIGGDVLPGRPEADPGDCKG